MVNNNFTELLIYATPALASAAVAGAAWWTQPGRVALRAAGSVSVGLAALIGVTIGVVVYSGHAADVSTGRALGGALVAFVASALPLGLYWAMGRLVRRLVVLVVAWVASLAPLYYYALFAVLITYSLTQCGATTSECLG
jgi:hypothetical protein